MKRIYCELHLFDLHQKVYIIDTETGDKECVAIAPMEELPEVYGAEQAMIDGCFVSENGTARENKELFQSFAENARNGMPKKRPKG